MAPAIVGTFLITGMAALMAVPLGVFGAIYLNEYGKQKPLAQVIRTMADVMTGVPSIVMGLFIYTVVVVVTGEQTGFAGCAGPGLPDAADRDPQQRGDAPPGPRRPTAGEPGAGRPAVAHHLTVVLPAAISGIASGALLAIARAAGETAPLVATIGIAFTVNPNLFSGQNTALPAQIFRNASQPFEGAQERAWGAALTLVAIVFVFTVLGQSRGQPLCHQGTLRCPILSSRERRPTVAGNSRPPRQPRQGLRCTSPRRQPPWKLRTTSSRRSRPGG